MNLGKYKTWEDKQIDVSNNKNSLYYWIDFGSNFYGAITSKWLSQKTNYLSITNHNLYRNYNFWVSLATSSKEQTSNIYKTKKYKILQIINCTKYGYPLLIFFLF